MDTLNKYRKAVRDLIEEYASLEPSYGEISTEIVVDDEKGHYEIMQMGWLGSQRIHGSVIHIDLIDGKIWIQYDGTSPGVAHELVEAGVPREAIVLGFRPPHIRPHTGFGVG